MSDIYAAANAGKATDVAAVPRGRPRTVSTETLERYLVIRIAYESWLCRDGWAVIRKERYKKFLQDRLGWTIEEFRLAMKNTTPTKLSHKRYREILKQRRFWGLSKSIKR